MEIEILTPTIITLMNWEGDSMNSDRIIAFLDRCFFLNSTESLLSVTKPTSIPAKKPANKKAIMMPNNKKVSIIANIGC